MILAEDEVGIGDDHAGIMVLAGRTSRPARRWPSTLPIADEVIELEVTPNRPDVMSVYGVARELHAVTGAPLAEDPTAAGRGARGPDSAARPRVASRSTPRSACASPRGVFEDVKIGPSPLWLKQRLMAAGQRPISNVVDITNYVMLTTRPAAARVRPRPGARRADRRARAPATARR